MKSTTKVFAILSAAAIATVSTSCANQEKVEQEKRCEAGEALVSQELDKLNVLAMKGKALYQKFKQLDDRGSLTLAYKVMNQAEELELEVGQATQVFIGRYEEYVEACQDEEREDKFRETKVRPVITRMTNITSD